jgi:glucan phosphoethanolaminetransferase (alkaline phosphatase superfamily)
LIYPPEQEVKEIIDTASSASFLDIYLELVVWVCFDVLFFISEFHFLFLLIFILFWLACIYLCCWCFPLGVYFNVCLFKNNTSKHIHTTSILTKPTVCKHK